MSDYKIPLIKNGENSLQIDVDLNIYAKEAINAACYKYTDKFWIHQQTTDNSNVRVIFEQKKDSQDALTDDIAKQFSNDLIDQQLRIDVVKQNGHIRDLIVEEAFKPVQK